LDDDDFVYARQLNLETIHRHDVLAERTGTIGEVRHELAGAVAERHTDLREWFLRPL
jgi:GTP cyclohydrolase I/GTP cyclohydrolase-4